MKLKEFNPDNCITTRSFNGVASIGINFKMGLFRFNQAASGLMNLKDGDSVKFFQDEDDASCWYVEKAEGGFLLRQKETSGKALLFNNATLAKQISDSAQAKVKSGKCLLAGTPTVFQKRSLFGVITGTLTSEA